MTNFQEIWTISILLLSSILFDNLILLSSKPYRCLPKLCSHPNLGLNIALAHKYRWTRNMIFSEIFENQNFKKMHNIEIKFSVATRNYAMTYYQSLEEIPWPLRPAKIKNIAGRLPENSRNSFIDLQSRKTVKKTEQKLLCSIKDEIYFY